MATFLQLRNWAHYQHYKDRSPPWVKLYIDILSSETWVAGDDASRTLAIALIVLAARTNNKIPWNPAYIKRVAYLNHEPDVRPLIETQFIEFVEEPVSISTSASDVLASCTSEKSREEQRRDREEGERERAPAKDAIKTLANPEVPRETRGVRYFNGNLTATAEEIYGQTLEAWRDVEGVNMPAFESWLTDLERRGKPLQPNARLMQAKYLAGQGNPAEQAEVVDHCMANEYRRLIPLSDVHGKAGSSAKRKRWHPDDGDPTAVRN